MAAQDQPHENLVFPEPRENPVETQRSLMELSRSVAAIRKPQGIARLINFSGKLLGAHVAHAGLIVFWVCWIYEFGTLKWLTLYQRSLCMSRD